MCVSSLRWTHPLLPAVEKRDRDEGAPLGTTPGTAEPDRSLDCPPRLRQNCCNLRPTDDYRLPTDSLPGTACDCPVLPTTSSAAQCCLVLPTAAYLPPPTTGERSLSLTIPLSDDPPGRGGRQLRDPEWPS